ncbi:response regulator [Clostridium sp. MCC353]|uniref:response regulator transcription factor n=1 Tax=Clostridium sp. MCC353 TaxID=2592646 RepID=UPI001C02463F|nr:response regulator transcription factor [Clostridium sp. MCC353]MBT9775652.1 response regulator [Clostridium sp. MCC353]
MGQKVLIADDSQDIIEILQILLTGEGYEVITASDGDEAVRLADETIDLIILDVMMPLKSGYVACAEIRQKTMAPILFLTAKMQDSDKAMGFSAGGDDYLTKPFSYSELLSRVKSLIRRYCVYQGKGTVSNSSRLCLGELAVDKDTRTVTLEGKEVYLTAREYGILVLMMENRRKVFSSENIYESVWKEPYFYSANNNVMVHIRNIRKKIEKDPQNPEYIKTMWGRGYYIE